MNDKLNEVAELPTTNGAIASRSESGNILPLIQQALANGVEPDKLEKMLELHEKWTQARAAERFGDALAAFQAECPQIKKSRQSKGGKWTFQYASLDDIDKVVRPIMAKHGISAAFDSQHVLVDKGPAVINVTVRIRVGSYFEDRKFGCPIPTDLNASQPQQWGAALSYAKRYALCAALDIVVTDEDNDAVDVVDTISAVQMVELENLIRETGTNLDRFLAWAQAESLDRLPKAQFNKALLALKQKTDSSKK